jgi:antitoxin component HigA of HigAB toxin-antitoxin module
MNPEHPIAPAIDAARYRRLMAEVAPKAIKTEAENDAALCKVEKPMQKGDEGRTPEEEAALELLTMLIEQFEEEAYPAPTRDPVSTLRLLMESNDLKAFKEEHLPPRSGGVVAVAVPIFSGDTPVVYREVVSPEKSKEV